MGVLRDRMVREMSLREFSVSFQQLYLATLIDLATYHHQSPDTLDPTQVQNFLLYLTQERPLAWSSVSVAASAIRFFYTHTVKRRSAGCCSRVHSTEDPNRSATNEEQLLAYCQDAR